MCFIEPPKLEHNKLVVNKQCAFNNTLLPFLLYLKRTKSSEMVYLMSKVYFLKSCTGERRNMMNSKWLCVTIKFPNLSADEMIMLLIKAGGKCCWALDKMSYWNPLYLLLIRFWTQIDLDCWKLGYLKALRSSIALLIIFTSAFPAAIQRERERLL